MTLKPQSPTAPHGCGEQRSTEVESRCSPRLCTKRSVENGSAAAVTVVLACQDFALERAAEQVSLPKHCPPRTLLDGVAGSRAGTLS